MMLLHTNSTHGLQEEQGWLKAFMLSTIIFLILFLVGLTPAWGAAIVEVEWEKTLGTKQIDRGYFAIQTKDGGYIVVGETMSAYMYGKGGYDVYLAKLDASGNTSWYKTYGSVRDERGNWVQETEDGGFIITGSMRTFSQNNNNQLYLIKTGPSGQIEWEKTFGGSGESTGNCVKQTTDGGYIVVGETTSFGTGSSDVYLVKTNATGKQEWEKTFGGKEVDYGTCVFQTDDGGFIVAGATSSFGAGGFDIYLVKTDTAGKKEWEKTFGGKGWDNPEYVEQTEDGGYIVTGRSSSFSQGNYDVYLVKTNTKGTKEWEHTFGGNGWDTGKWVQQTGDGGYMVAGWSDSFGTGGFAFYLVKTDATGKKLGAQTLEGDRFDEKFSVRGTDDGGYIIAGFWADRLRNMQFHNDDVQVYAAKLKGEPKSAPAHTGIMIRVNKDMLAADSPPVIDQGRVLVPYRAIAEALGADISWDQETRTVTLSLGENKIQLKTGSSTALVNDQPANLEMPARTINERTYVPLRFISQSLGAEVNWDDETKTVSIMTVP